MSRPFGFKHTKQIRKKISLAARRAQIGEGNGFFGRHHTVEHKHRMSKLMTGRKISDETRKKLSGRVVTKSTREKLAKAMCRRLSRGFRNTVLERSLYLMLYEAGISFRAQEPIGRFLIDAFDIDNNLAWEASGSYWHSLRESQRPGYEQNRDNILRRSGIKDVIHLNEEDLKPWVRRILKCRGI